jgi:diguanylate cyclase (GGDEF)-like protein/PAS domain S-box-containing protein
VVALEQGEELVVRTLEFHAAAAGSSGDPKPTIHMTRDALGVITSVDDGIFALLGWRPEQLIGLPSTNYIHPADQPSAIAAWMEMIASPGREHPWRGRYKTESGALRWVETTNTYVNTDVPHVTSSMREASAEEVSLEEQFQARGQLLNQLSDALPVGVFQVDLEGHITLTNNSFHVIVGMPFGGSIYEQMSSVRADDRPVLRAALTRAFANESVDNIELRLNVPTAGELLGPNQWRVCLLGLRPLTDSDGVVSGAVGCLSDVTERSLLYRELEERASIDKLTSCLNRAATLDLVDQTISAQHIGAGRAVIFIDIDRLKSVNDDLGHAAGDRLLITAVDRVRTALRNGDYVGRLGGDEFLVICPRVGSVEAALEIAQRISVALTASVDLGPATVELRASVGLVWTTEALDADTLIAQADSAMYESKRSGRHGVTLFADAGIHSKTPGTAS